MMIIRLGATWLVVGATVLTVALLGAALWLLPRVLGAPIAESAAVTFRLCGIPAAALAPGLECLRRIHPRRRFGLVGCEERSRGDPNEVEIVVRLDPKIAYGGRAYLDGNKKRVIELKDVSAMPHEYQHHDKGEVGLPRWASGQLINAFADVWIDCSIGWSCDDKGSAR